MNRTRKEWEELEFSTPIQLDRDMVFEARGDILELHDKLSDLIEFTSGVSKDLLDEHERGYRRCLRDNRIIYGGFMAIQSQSK